MKQKDKDVWITILFMMVWDLFWFLLPFMIANHFRYTPGLETWFAAFLLLFTLGKDLKLNKEK